LSPSGTADHQGGDGEDGDDNQEQRQAEDPVADEQPAGRHDRQDHRSHA
jgi:hypothetical protein